ncbi:transporter, major facilitator family protein [Selenomonas noxia ATCC 43541]|jgi:MFS family major facilitator transporter, multidrug:cation symporter|nr:transporter, major facilitator family protein [Selenomonas noxia ATCC 43541]
MPRMNWKVVLALLTCNVLFMSASYTMIIPFLPMYLTNELGVDDTSVSLWAGLSFSVTFFVSAVMAPIWGRIADRKGKRLMAMRASLLIAISYLLGGIVTSPEQLIIVRVFQGFASGLWPMDLAIMTLYAPQERLGFSLGIMQGTLTAGGVVGPLLGGVLAELFGMRTSFYIGGLALFINFLAFTFIIKEPPMPKSTVPLTAEEKNPMHLWHIPILRTMMIVSTLAQMVLYILMPVITTYIKALAGSMDNIVFVAGAVFSLSGIAGAIAAPLWGIYGTRRTYFNSMFLAMLFGGIMFTLQGIPDTLMPFAVMQFGVGLFIAGIQPSLNAIIAQHTPPQLKGSVFGLLFSAQQIGGAAGPLLGGVVATYLGMHYLFPTAGAILLLLALFVRWRYIMNRHAAAE